MFDETKTTETPNPSDGDPREDAESQAPDEDSRDAESREPDYKRMYLDAKTKVERANQVEAELAEIKARLGQSPAATSDAPVEDDEDAQVLEWADKKDPVAMKLLKMERNQIHLYELGLIEDKAKRDRVREHFKKNRHRLGDVQAAEAEVDSQVLAEENNKLRDELKRATVKNDPDVVRTHSREVPASQHKTRMTAKEWANEQKNLPPLDRMARQRALNEGKIVVED